MERGNAQTTDRLSVYMNECECVCVFACFSSDDIRSLVLVGLAAYLLSCMCVKWHNALFAVRLCAKELH